MGQPPTPIDRKSVSRAGVVGALLGALAIGLFFALWIFTGSAGVEPFPRLVISICVPPIILAVLAGVYLLVVRPSGTPPQG